MNLTFLEDFPDYGLGRGALAGTIELAAVKLTVLNLSLAVEWSSKL